MNVLIKSVISPFSFFCVVDDESTHGKITKDIAIKTTSSDNIKLSDVDHGQYVAVLLEGRWARGIVLVENQVKIWLVDHGTYIRPTESTVFVDLPAEYKKLPSKVFEASIHGVTPIGLDLDDHCQFVRKTELSWSIGACEQADALIGRAISTYFVPIAFLRTKSKFVVLGDLYLQFEGEMYINLIEEMSKDFPMHKLMERNEEVYINNLSTYYSNGTIHGACSLKPELPMQDLPMMTTEATLVQYNAICGKVETLTQVDSDSSSAGGSSVTYIENIRNAPKKILKLTPSEIEMYSNEYIVVGGREYNVLTVLMNKAHDLYMCERYKGATSVGRATTRLTPRK